MRLIKLFAEYELRGRITYKISETPFSVTTIKEEDDMKDQDYIQKLSESPHLIKQSKLNDLRR